jgi:tetratricopeptide (TPR) repeat protein
LLPHLAETLNTGNADARKLRLDRIRLEAGRATADPYAQRVLGLAEILHGDRQEGIRLVEALLQAAPEDAELLYARGMADFLPGQADESLRTERYAAARPWFEKALRAEPAYYTAAYRLSECEMRAGDAPKAVGHLQSAWSQAPMVGEIAITAGGVLTRLNRPDIARRVLTPISAYPQRAEGRRALEMLEKLPTGN